MKKIIIVLALFSCAALAFSAGSSEKQDELKIGISKIVKHPALDAVEQGIQDELKELGYANVQYDLQDAAGDMNTASQIANKFKFEKVNIAVGIATPTAIALATNITDVPVVFTAVTDPVDAGLVDNLTSGKNNITGISDMTPVAEQIKMLAKAVKIKSLGHVYTSGEPNAVRLAEIAKKTCEELGIEFISTSVTNSSEVKNATEAIVGKVDGIYISTDNTVVSAIDALMQVADAAGVPVISADPTSATSYNILAAYGFDYYRMGRVTGRIIDRILKGEKPASMPTTFLTDRNDLQLVVNLDVAKKLGIELDPKLVNDADVIVENGEIKKK